jgi:hypothetical protein
LANNTAVTSQNAVLAPIIVKHNFRADCPVCAGIH